MRGTAPWRTLAAEQPVLAGDGERLLYRGGDTASAFLATVSPAGTPRVHPVFPILHAGELWLFVVEMSPKYRDLRANGRFALHALPPQDGGEEFMLQGRAEAMDDAGTRAAVVDATQGRQGAHAFERLLRCDLAAALHTRWEGWGTTAAWPHYTKWHAGEHASPG